MFTRIAISLGNASYDAVVGAGAVAELPALLQRLQPTNTVVITDENVARVHGDRVSALLGARMITVPPGESSKSLAELDKVYAGLLGPGDLDRGSVIVALGGGMVGDLAGFVAATLLRGIRWVCLPTSLLAMVDSSIGGKTAINRPTGKNLVGAFHQPSAVICDLDFLATLPKREFVSALSESVKTAVIGDLDLLQHMQARAKALLQRDEHAVRVMIDRCLRFKAGVVAEDERETTGRRAILNFGHTVAHALEALYPGRWLHGEAVAIGLCSALRCCIARAGLPENHAAGIITLLNDLELPIAPPDDLSASALLNAMNADKKRSGDVLRFVVVPELGRAEVSSFAADTALAEILLGRDHG